MIHIIRHGQSLHNIQRGYPHRDPPLTQAGIETAKQVNIPTLPDLIDISPMTRTIQTALIAFPSVLVMGPPESEIQIWPELREAHDAICNKGESRAKLSANFPQLSFVECPEEWDYPPHSVEGATVRAEKVRRRLKLLSQTYRNIAVITHRGFIAYLVQGDRFDVCETRSYRFELEGTARTESLRMGINVDTNELQDFGPTVLWPIEDVELLDSRDAKNLE